MSENELTSKIISAALKVHKLLGPGLLESTYEHCLAHLLIKEGLKVECQKALPLIFEDVKLEAGYRLDMLINDQVVVEVKSVEALIEIHMAQMITYLRLSGCRVGLLINFNTTILKNGIRRCINGY
jgi:GxxExxY protein